MSIRNFAAIDIRLFRGSLQIISTSDAAMGALHITDVDTEKRIQTLKTESLDFLEFDSDNNMIMYSDRGTVNLDRFDLSSNQVTSKEERIVYQGYGVHVSWVLKDNRPMIWISPEHQWNRGQCAISKSQIAVVCRSGHLLFIDL